MTTFTRARAPVEPRTADIVTFAAPYEFGQVDDLERVQKPVLAIEVLLMGLLG